MKVHQSWNPYGGAGSLVLAAVLLIVTGILLYLAFRLHRPKKVKRPGKLLGASIVVILLLSVTNFLIASGIYALALYQQIGPFTVEANPITPVTLVSAALAFFVILVLTQRSGPGIAFGSAIVGAIAGPMIFELPFDLIVMWRTNPPHPAATFTLLYFLPLFLIELSCFAMLTFSPVMKLSRYTLFFLASMFLVFAVWALFGFAYPAAPLPIAFNMISKVLAFATAVSLFLPSEKVVAQDKSVEPAKVIEQDTNVEQATAVHS